MASKQGEKVTESDQDSCLPLPDYKYEGACHLLARNLQAAWTAVCDTDRHAIGEMLASFSMATSAKARIPPMQTDKAKYRA